MVGMPKMQEQFSAMARDGPYAENAGAIFGPTIQAWCLVWNVRVGIAKIECGERAVDGFTLAIKLHGELANSQFLFDEHHEIDKAHTFELAVLADTGPQAPFEPHG